MYQSLIICMLLANVNSNTFCEMSIPSTTIIHRFQGEMNVPIKPTVEPGKVLFLWPGINPYGGEGGLMQPVLTYGANYGQGNKVWGMANWFSDCPGYCHDPYQSVKEGDTISFYMQYIETYKNGSQHWEMGYESYNNPKISSKLQVYREGHNPECFWATESEFYLNSSDPNNYSKLPSSYFYTWNLYAFTNMNNQSVKLNWTPHNSEAASGNRVNCSYPVLNGIGTRLIFGPYNNGCTTKGYSRDWNEACQSYCGCNNDDGTKKVQCDYCCFNSNGSCKREAGPTVEVVYNVYSNDTHDDLPHPGNV
eukprot:290997_1